MPAWIAKKVIVALSRGGRAPSDARVLVLGVTFKEDVSDIRNSKVIDLVRELRDYGVSVDVTDPEASSAQLEREYGLRLAEAGTGYDVIISTVAHAAYKSMTQAEIMGLGTDEVVLFDLKGLFPWGKTLGNRYWKL